MTPEHVTTDAVLVTPESRRASNRPSDLWKMVDRSGGPDACWPFTGARIRGYGQWTYRRKGVRAHRMAWEIANGPIPADMMVCHRCDNPPCCNPAHLFIGSAADNVADMRAKGRAKEHTHGSEHGTYSGYMRHAQRRGGWTMPACDECRAANTAYHRNRQLSRNTTFSVAAFIEGVD